MIFGLGLIIWSFSSLSGQGFAQKVDHGIVVGYPFQILDNTTSALYLAYNPDIPIETHSDLMLVFKAKYTL